MLVIDKLLAENELMCIVSVRVFKSDNQLSAVNKKETVKRRSGKC